MTVLTPQTLLDLLAAPFKRVTGTRHYRRVGVVSVDWDYDGPSTKVPGTDNNFTALSTELTDLLRNVYNYETFHITLPTSRDEPHVQAPGRNGRAVFHLQKTFNQIAPHFNHEDCALIVIYRGHSVPRYRASDDFPLGRSETAQHTYGTHPNGSRDGVELFLAYVLSSPLPSMFQCT